MLPNLNFEVNQSNIKINVSVPPFKYQVARPPSKQWHERKSVTKMMRCTRTDKEGDSRERERVWEEK
jgi:hypothetical protein